MNYIVDSSIIARMYLTNDDKQAKKLARLVHSNKIFSIDFMRYEVANAFRNSKLEDSLVETLLEEINKLKIKYLKVSEQILFQAFVFSKDINNAIYDSLYHFLALSKGYTFATLDKKYYKAAKHIGGIKLL